MLPIFENSLAALSNLPAPVVEAARGMGMTEGQVLRQVELPGASADHRGCSADHGDLAFHRRHRLHRGSQGTGEVIIAGLLSDNAAFILQEASSSPDWPC